MTFNEEARLSIHHWKDSWHKRMYKLSQRRVRDNPEEYFSNHNITEVVRITTNQQHGLDYMEQIIVMRENDKPDSYLGADFKYLNKNDIEDLYYLCLNKKVNVHENKLKNSLITFIRSCVIWERVHDFQLGIESYQIKVNLTAPTLTFSDIEAHDPYSILDKPNTGLIYLNNKEEKRVMYLAEIIKFCDATLERVLKEVKLKIFKSEPWKKPPLLGELDIDILKPYEREITKRLRHRVQMRSLSVDLNIKSPKCKLAEDKFSFVSLKTVQLQLFRYAKRVWDLGGRGGKHKKNDGSNVGADSDSKWMRIVGKKANEPICVTQVLVTESAGSLNDATVYADVSTEAPNTTSLTINVVNSETTSPNQNSGDKVGNESGMNKFPYSYVNKLSPKSLTKANLRKFKANVPYDDDYDVWLPLALVDEVNDRMKNSLYVYFIVCAWNGPWMIRGIPIHLNEWLPSVSLLKEKLSRVPVWVKFHDVSSVAHTSDGLNLMATKIGTPVMLDSYTNSMCLESWGRSSYARILIEINACNEFSDHLMIAVSNLELSGYTKETIRIEYEWKPPHCRTSLPKTTPFVGTSKTSTSGHNKESSSNKGNTFSLSNSFAALNDENLIIKEVASRVNLSLWMVMENHWKNVDYLGDLGNDDEVEPVDNEMVTFWASKPTGVGYGPESLLEQWKESNAKDDCDPYDDDMYEG
ncbi:retrovirus-related pol polyprotein from transposon TNT 1-94 [Tanacetum coccineum]